MKLNCNYLLSYFLTPTQYAYGVLAVLLIFIVYVGVFYRSIIVYIGSALLLIGGFLNSSQRLQSGCVIDMYNFFDLFSFNNADILVTIGILVIIFGVEKYENRSSYRR